MRLAINQTLTHWLEMCFCFDAIVLHANGGYLKQPVKTLGVCALITTAAKTQLEVSDPIFLMMLNDRQGQYGGIRECTNRV
jgi:hypothetical protein